jgi:hypothetical protein
VFHREGLRSATLERALVTAVGAVPSRAAPLVADSLERMGLEVPEQLRAARTQSALATMRRPWGMTRNDAYDVTHEIIALTDVGREPLPFGQPYVRRWLPVWIRQFELADDNDLLAEMIAASHFAGVGCAQPAAWRALQAAQRDDGMVPFSSSSRVAHHAVGDYHSTLMTLVAGLVCRHDAPQHDAS